MSTAEARNAEILESLAEVRARVKLVAPNSATLVAVSKYKPASDIQACFDDGQLDFGENYVQELEDKAKMLPVEIRWHFIGTLQSNKAKVLAAIPNLYSIQTLTSTKAATALNKSLPPERTSRLNILIQINTSGEDSKSGLDPLDASASDADAEATQLARHIITACPRLRLQGLMTIGALEQSLTAGDENADFERLKRTRDALAKLLAEEFGADGERWGAEGTGRLLLSMGMSSDFEAALKAGSEIVRVGTGIFGARAKK
ncbi:proline synthetase associated protein [Mycena rosella]|uniref:Pyridoxal phosphate homeostasis protein n=1 Tax=Mycena rosella TaxID=1033263 RepID=A0AAD7GFC0_MYCRO|nr:proline synthetase associated protein [Mycena rosella]